MASNGNGPEIIEFLPDLTSKKKKEIICTFDDRDKVVNMWRENGLTCMQVAPGNF